MTGVLSLGLMGSVDAAILRQLAPRLEAAGFHALWLNDSGSDTLEALAAVAEVTSTLVLATGVMPLDRRTPEAIAASVESLGLPAERLVLGVGSGSSRRPLELVAAGLAELRSLTDATLVLGALGPKMRALGSRSADGLLLSWLTPDAAAAAAAESRAEAAASDQQPARIVLYARTAVDDAARANLATESAAYGGYPAYAANFARLGFGPTDTTIGPATAGSGALGNRVDAYLDVVDELVLRAITPSGSLDELLRFVDNPDLAGRASPPHRPRRP